MIGPPSIGARIRAALASNPQETNKAIARRLECHFWRVHDQRDRLGIPQLKRGKRARTTP